MQKIQPSQSGGPAVATPITGVPAEFHTWYARCREEVEEALARHFKEIESTLGPHSRLSEAVQYSVQAGGKRLRPILVLETCRLFCGNAVVATPPALAMEFVHTFSLIHDDLPAMDDDDLRRGRPTNHKVFGEALAILAGDWLLAHAMTLLASDRIPHDLVACLLKALGTGTMDMIEGQAADIEGERKEPDAERLLYIHGHKTAALLEACCRLGGICAEAPADAVATVARYGRHLGLAFQIADDLLDARGSEAQLGKRVGKDAAHAKQTYPATFGLAEAEAQAQREVDHALEALEPFGLRADHLRDLARYVVLRDR